MRTVVTDPGVWPWLRDSAALAARGVDLEYVPDDGPDGGPDAVRERLRGADAYVGVFFDDGLRPALGPDFTLLQITAAGTDHVALDALPTRVTVANAHGHGRSIAEHVLMTVLAVHRQLLWRDAELRRGRWHTRLVDPDAPRFGTLPGTVVGIVGLGHIGRAVARLCGAVGMRPVAVRRSARGRDTTDPDLEWIDGIGALDELLDACRVLVLTCPLTEETRGLIGARRLRRLGADGLLVNVSRGAVVDETALYEALRDRTIAGAALDVWHTPASPGTVPPSRLPFAELDNVVMTPHCSANADDTYRDRAEEVADNLLRLSVGAPLRNVVRAGGTP